MKLLRKRAITLTEVLIAFAIFSFAIIPAVNVMLYFERKSYTGVFDSFALSYAKTIMGKFQNLTREELKIVMGNDREKSIASEKFNISGRVFLDLTPVQYKSAFFTQKLFIYKYKPTFLFWDGREYLKRKSRADIYRFNYEISWKEGKKRRSLNFELFKSFY